MPTAKAHVFTSPSAFKTCSCPPGVGSVSGFSSISCVPALLLTLNSLVLLLTCTPLLMMLAAVSCWRRVAHQVKLETATTLGGAGGLKVALTMKGCQVAPG
jgi:hypothetical protein